MKIQEVISGILARGGRKTAPKHEMPAELIEPALWGRLEKIKVASKEHGTITLALSLQYYARDRLDANTDISERMYHAGDILKEAVHSCAQALSKTPEDWNKIVTAKDGEMGEIARRYLKPYIDAEIAKLTPESPDAGSRPHFTLYRYSPPPVERDPTEKKINWLIGQLRQDNHAIIIEEKKNIPELGLRVTPSKINPYKALARYAEAHLPEGSPPQTADRLVDLGIGDYVADTKWKHVTKALGSHHSLSVTLMCVEIQNKVNDRLKVFLATGQLPEASARRGQGAEATRSR